LSPIGYKEDDTFRRQTIDMAEKIHTTSETELTIQRTSQSERVCLFVFLSLVSYEFKLNLLGSLRDRLTIECILHIYTSTRGIYAVLVTIYVIKIGH